MNFRKYAAGTAACLALSPICGDANAQSRLEQLPDIVVTAGRAPEPIGSTGSAISVISGETLTTSNPGSLTDALRSVPGCDEAAEIAEVRAEPAGMVLVDTAFGGRRVMDLLAGDPLPRIC